MTSFGPAVELLRSIPGVERRAAEVMIAEIGADMSVFPSAAHLASWAGLCPGQNESAGKRKSAKTRKGSKWLRKTLTESARAAARTKESYLSRATAGSPLGAATRRRSSRSATRSHRLLARSLHGRAVPRAGR
jgi:transposase